jgi:hypothetical protein
MKDAAGPADDLVAIYPGSFDPITNGHIDIIRRPSTTRAASVPASSSVAYGPFPTSSTNSR